MNHLLVLIHLDGTKFDDEDALNDAYELELRRKEKGYKPPD